MLSNSTLCLSVPIKRPCHCVSVPAPVLGSLNRVCRAPLRPRRAVPVDFNEIKHDGFRILARRDSAGVRLITRAGNDFSSRFPFISMAVSKLPVSSCLIDGEAIVCDENGLAVFELIRRYGAFANDVLCAFDLLELDGRDLRREPIERRKTLLAKLLKGSPSSIVLNEYYEEEGEIVFREACKLGCEGIVSKRLSARPRRIGASKRSIRLYLSNLSYPTSARQLLHCNVECHRESPNKSVGFIITGRENKAIKLGTGG